MLVSRSIERIAKHNRLSVVLFATLLSVLFVHSMQVTTIGDDFIFILSRISGLENIVTSPINFAAYFKDGYALNIFYPFLTLLPATLLFSFSHSILFSYFVFTYIINIATALIVLFVGKRFFSSNILAVFLSILYLLTPYRISDLYHRADIGESIAMLIFPLVIYGYYLIVKQNADKHQWWLLGISIGLMVQTHLISAMLTVALLSVLFIGQLIIQNKRFIWNKLLLIAKAAGIALLISLPFIGLLVNEVLFQKMSQPMFIGYLSATANNFFDALRLAALNQPSNYTMGWIGLASIILPFFVWKRFDNLQKATQVINVFLFILTTNIFPWGLFDKTPLQFMQFTFRIFFLQAFFGVVILLMTMQKIKKKSLFKYKNWFYALFALVVLSPVYHYWDVSQNTVKKNDDQTQLILNRNNIDSYLFGDNQPDYFQFDYAPAASTNEATKTQIKMQLVTDQNGNVMNTYQREYQSDQQIYNFNLDTRTQITLPIFQYRITQVIIDGKNQPVIKTNDGLVHLTLDKGAHKIVVKAPYPIWGIITWIIALITTTALVFYTIKHKKTTSS